MPYDRIIVCNTYAELICVTVGVEEVQQCSARGLKSFVQRSLNPREASFLSLVLWRDSLLTTCSRKAIESAGFGLTAPQGDRGVWGKAGEASAQGLGRRYPLSVLTPRPLLSMTYIFLEHSKASAQVAARFGETKRKI
jgi:hypothetical protein